MDSTGLGMVVTHYTRCQARGIRMVVAGSTKRVLDLFALTKVDTILPLAATVDEVDLP
jgi:anti-anti-sigma factor